MNQIRTCGLNFVQTHSLLHNLIYLSVQGRIRPKVKLLFLFLQYDSIFHFVLAKKRLKKQVNCYYFQPFTPYFLSTFKRRTCILHHIAFLFCLPAHYFLRPITRFQPPKSHFLGVVLPFSAMCFMSLRGYIYTIAVCIYAFWARIQSHLVPHLAPKRTAFSTKTHCIQYQNALHLVSKRTAFSSILHCVQHQNALHLAATSPKPSANAVSFK